MSLDTVTLKWDLTDLIEAGLSATLSITPTAQMSDTADHILIPPVARTYAFTGGAGQLAGIVANDNAAIAPAGTGYLISVTAASGQVIVPQFQTQILTANGATQWLDALAVVPVVATAYQYLPLPSGTPTAGDVPIATGTGEASAWGPNGSGGGGSGTVTSVSVATANGFAGTVATATTTPAVTVKTTVTGLLKGNGTAVSAATAGTDYLAPAGSGAALTGITAAQVGADASGAAAGVQTNLTAEVSRAEAAEALLAPLASPALTGTPTAPTATALTNSTRIATTAYADSAVGVETTRAQTAEALKAPLASPALTGTPTAPTATALTDSTQLATTAYADLAVGVETTRAEAAEALLVPKSGTTMTGPLIPKVSTLTQSGGSVAVAFTAANVYRLVLTASGWTLSNPTGFTDGQPVRVRLIQDGTGSRTISFGTAWDFGAAGAPTLSTAANKVDYIVGEWSADANAGAGAVAVSAALGY